MPDKLLKLLKEGWEIRYEPGREAVCFYKADSKGAKGMDFLKIVHPGLETHESYEIGELIGKHLTKYAQERIQ